MQLDTLSVIGVRGFSFEYTIFKESTFLFLNSYLITLASGHIEVEYISAISNLVGSNLFPAPILEIIGMFFSFAFTAKSILEVTVSMASII
ncbi:hypothetical protein D3C71_1628620 [compost metagenome]